jgi:hypothetical protein
LEPLPLGFLKSKFDEAYKGNPMELILGTIINLFFVKIGLNTNNGVELA